MAASTLYLAKLSSISDYGSYISAIAIIGFFTPFVHGGMSYVYLDCDNLMAVKKEDCEKYWKTSLYISGIIAGLIAYLSIEAFTDNRLSIFTVMMIAITEISLLGFCEIESKKEQLLDNSKKMGGWQTIPHALRLIFFIISTNIFTGNIIEQWVFASIFGVAICLLFAKKNKSEKIKFKSIYDFFKKSIHYGVGGSSLKIMLEIDKPILSSVSGHVATAQLSIAQRLADMASIPTNAIVSLSLTRMLRADSNVKKIRILKKSIFIGLAISTTLFSVIFIFSPLVTSFLGNDYHYSNTLLTFLLWAPATSLVRGMLGNWLATSGYPELYSRYNVFGAFIRSAGCFPLVFLYGAIGSIIGLAISEAVVIMIMLMKLIKTSRI